MQVTWGTAMAVGMEGTITVRTGMTPTADLQMIRVVRDMMIRRRTQRIRGGHLILGLPGMLRLRDIKGVKGTREAQGIMAMLAGADMDSRRRTRTGWEILPLV